ncbi:Predicted PurR-regulated permease PerM [Faunimonas pinastri]|uniref:Predicted PurR-regulated permease PerM n=1 Tax=Faunimonas pinastri TaxID=1855383 RepID=A0A1H9M1K4_9HYPH|nr:AI-2E family transporter [Faunimonas pinastri]SER17560.1 Predicted PurR-regulated permease PerM [Faunimonas pinastri]
MNELARSREAGAVAAEERGHRSSSFPRWPVIGLFILAVGATLYVAKGFIVPVLLAFLLALVLSPVVRFFARRKVPESLTAIVLVAIAIIVLFLGAYFLSGPIGDWLHKVPTLGAEVQNKLSRLRGPIERLQHASQQLEEIASGPKGAAQEVVVKTPALTNSAVAYAPDIVAKFMFAFFLLLFLLASGDMFYMKLVRAMPSLKDKKTALRIAHDIERELSRYLFTITVINISLGIVVGAGLWLIGIPTPMLWGVLATVLNYIPYVGPVMGIVTVGAVSLVSTDTLTHALYGPGFYLLCVTVEGQFLTPMILGRRLEMNAVSVFLAVAFWGWLWGLVGMLMAVPLMVAVKIFCTHIGVLNAFGDFLSEEPERHEPPSGGTEETASAV